jgi:hypothetical protein
MPTDGSSGGLRLVVWRCGGWRRAMTRPHWLAPAGRNWTPGMVVCFDTETESGKRGADEVLTLRCWDAVSRFRGIIGDDADSVLRHSGESAANLAAVLEASADYYGECWAFAHNVGFDLTVTSLPMVLTERGWDSDFVSLGDESCVFVLKRGRAKLVITDSWSWLRSPLRDAARDVGMRTGHLPDDLGSLDQWHRRCAHDVAILDRLISELLDWWDRSKLGRFGVTGAACGWRALRALTEPRSVLVGPDPPRTAFERRALYSGRKEVWQVGEVKGKWVADYDLVAAHLTTAAYKLLPVAPLRDDRIGLIADPLEPPEGVGTICEVDITTSVPCAPVKIDGEVWWPVGTFRTVLTSAELTRVTAVAERVDVIQARWYRLGDPLQAWGRWCLGLLDSDRVDVPPVVRRVAKGWGRSVPGRFAIRVSTLIGERPATHLGWSVVSGSDLDTGEALESVSYGGVERTYRKDQDGADVFPAVLAFVEGYVRSAMAATLAERPAERLLQVNTDGWWEVCRDGREHVAADAAPAPYTVTRRAHERGVRIIGPNHVETASERRLSGVPKDALTLDGGGYSWQDWPGLRWQLEISRPGEYLRPRKGLELQSHYCRRWVLDSGETVPASAALDAQGSTVLLPWSRTSHRLAGDVLADRQVPALQALRDDEACRAPGPRPAGSPRLGRRTPASV